MPHGHSTEVPGDPIGRAHRPRESKSPRACCRLVLDRAAARRALETLTGPSRTPPARTRWRSRADCRWSNHTRRDEESRSPPRLFATLVQAPGCSAASPAAGVLPQPQGPPRRHCVALSPARKLLLEKGNRAPRQTRASSVSNGCQQKPRSSSDSYRARATGQSAQRSGKAPPGSDSRLAGPPRSLPRRR